MHIGTCLTGFTAAIVEPRRFVKMDAQAALLQAAAATDAIVGVSDTAGQIAAGGQIDYHVEMQPEIEAGGAVSPGVSVTADADGKAVPAGPGEVAGGYALQGADADGDIIRINFCRHTAA